MIFTLLITSFIAGLLTVVAPCVLPLLPVIVGGTLIDKNKWRPLIIVLSLAGSIVLFTLLLKVFTLFVNVPQDFWQYLSGGIIFVFGLILIFPSAWDWLSIKLHLSQSSEGLLAKAQQNHSLWGAVFLGAALGPVFSSCSPTYFVILATVLPVSFSEGLIYLLVYALGLAIIMFLIAILGRVLTNKLKFAANPQGWFKKTLGILLVLVGIAILSGLDKQVEGFLIDQGLGSTKLEQDLLKQVNLGAFGKTNQTAATIATSGIQVNNVNNQTLEWTDSNEGILANFGAAPEFIGLQNWINSQPLSLQQLRGKVVLLDFWTYSCINCIRKLPYVEKWYEQYSRDGLVVIGIHDPEFQFEKIFGNVQQATRDNGLTYPIVQDNDHMTWDAYNNHYWPAKYIIDRDGNLRYFHFGEGSYDETEKVIQTLLNMKSSVIVADQVIAEKAGSASLTPETYLGTFRRESNVPAGNDLLAGEWSINSVWNESDPEKIITSQTGASLKLNFYASTANLVLGGRGSATVMVDGKLLTEGAGSDVHNGILTINGARLYRLTNFGNQYSNHLIEITFDQPGIDAYAWTFG